MRRARRRRPSGAGGGAPSGRFLPRARRGARGLPRREGGNPPPTTIRHFPTATGAFRARTAALNDGATMFDDLFFSPSTSATSNAREEIWKSSEDFRRRAREFQDAARMLDQEVP